MLGVLTMVVRQIIRNGGFDPEDVARLSAAFTAAWKQIECRFDVASDLERDAIREKLAVIIVELGKSFHEIDAVELQARALAMLDTQIRGAHLRQRVAPTSGVVSRTQTQHRT